MTTIQIVFGVFCLYGSYVGATCPGSLNELPGGSFCARLYEHSSSDLSKSCGGRQHDLYHGQEVNLPGLFNDMTSSLVVQYPCVLTVWEHSGYKGHTTRFNPGIQRHLADITRGGWGWANWNDVISSIKCDCSGTGQVRGKK